MTGQPATGVDATADPRGHRIRSGVDVQSIRVFREFDPELGERLKRRLFTERERAYCEDTRCPAQHYAARWAAKESFVKLVGGLDGYAYDSVSVERGPAGPRLALTEDANEALGRALDVAPASVARDVSLSHDLAEGVAMAQVVAWRGVSGR